MKIVVGAPVNGIVGLDDRSLVAGPGARSGSKRFEERLSDSVSPRPAERPRSVASR
jgi:hypothetical protein